MERGQNHKEQNNGQFEENHHFIGADAFPNTFAQKEHDNKNNKHGWQIHNTPVKGVNR